MRPTRLTRPSGDSGVGLRAVSGAGGGSTHGRGIPWATNNQNVKQPDVKRYHYSSTKVKSKA